jgi:hypothetical protein
MRPDQPDDGEVSLFDLWMGMTPEEWDSLAPADDAAEPGTGEV